jgi:hypothetical protein
VRYCVCIVGGAIAGLVAFAALAFIASECFDDRLAEF